MAHIEKCVKDLLVKSGKKAASEHAAVWVPDSEATCCMVCKKSQFNLVNRRVRSCSEPATRFLNQYYESLSERLDSCLECQV